MHIFTQLFYKFNLLFLCGILASAYCHAISDGRDNDVYKVGVSNLILPPLLKINEHSASGFAGDVLNAFASQKGIKFKYIVMRQTQLQPKLEANELDFIFPDNPLWTNFRNPNSRNIYSKPIIFSVSATFVERTNKNISLAEVKTLAVPFGYTPYTWTEFVKNNNIQIVTSKDLLNGLKKLQLGQVDSADIEYNSGRYLISKYQQFEKLMFAPGLPNTSVAYHASTIRHIKLLEELSIFVSKNHTLIERLKEKHGVLYHHELFFPL